MISAFVNTVVSAFRTANTSVLYRKNPRIAGRENQSPLGKSDLVYRLPGSLIGITFYCNPHKIIGLEKKDAFSLDASSGTRTHISSLYSWY